MLTRVLLLASALLFLSLAIRARMAIPGPLIGRTIGSSSSNNPKSSEQAFLLFEHAAKTIPPHASVVVFKPKNRHDDEQVNRIANGQLPFHNVVPADTGADYVITLGAPFEDGRYERVHESPVGSIWRRVRW